MRPDAEAALCSIVQSRRALCVADIVHSLCGLNGPVTADVPSSPTSPPACSRCGGSHVLAWLRPV